VTNPIPQWRKACHANNTCVEVAAAQTLTDQFVIVRDARHQLLPLRLAAWRHLIAGVKAR
jgi:hypothetical protein